MDNKEAEVMKDEDQEVYEDAFMIDEDKQAICDALCKALQLTVAGNDLISITYKTYGPWTQRAILRFRGGNTQEVNVSMDGGILMIRDIMKQM